MNIWRTATCLSVTRTVRRTIVTSSVLATNREWKEKMREDKKRKDDRWRRRSTANPFVRNVGLAGQMKQLGLHPDDPELAHVNIEPGIDPSESLEEILEKTERFYKEMHRSHMERISPEKLARIITKKNFFPDPKSPNLLTWMEKQTIKYLHESDPGHWTPLKLSEAFPATELTIKKVIRSGAFVPPKRIALHDDGVRNNWQKLAEGELQLPADLSAHLKQHGSGFENREQLLAQANRPDLEKVVLERYAESLKPKALPVGEFGSIIRDYKAKVAEKQKLLNAGKETSSSPSVATNVDLKLSTSSLSRYSEWDPEIDVPSPYRETALLNADIDLRQERRMSIDKFRKTYLDSLKPSRVLLNKEELARVNPHKTAFFNWLEAEKKKDTLQESSKRSKISVNETLDDLKQERNFFSVQKYAKQSTNVEVRENETARDEARSDDKIVDLPEDSPEYALIRRGDSYYDREGNFVYRVTSNLKI